MAANTKWFNDSPAKIGKIEAIIMRMIAAAIGEIGSIPFTPFWLCHEIVEKLQPTGSILVMINVEFLYAVKKYYLGQGYKVKDIYFASSSKVKRNVVVVNGILPKDNVIELDKKSLTLKGSGRVKDFDFVVTNPPFHRPHKLLAGKKKNSHIPYWFLFTKLCLSLAAKGGTVALVTPSAWLQRTSGIHDSIVSKQLLFAKVFSESPFEHDDGDDVETTASYWILENEPRTVGSNLTVHFDNQPYTISEGAFVSGKADNIILRMSILDKTVNAVNTKFDMHTSNQHHTSNHKDRLSKKQHGKFQWPVFHNNNTRLFSSLQDALHGSPKVLISKTGSIMKCVTDLASSISESAFALVTPTMSEAEVAQSVLTSKLYRFLIDSVRITSTIPSDFLRALPAVKLTRSWSDKELYDYFNLSDAERDLIEDTIT